MPKFEKKKGKALSVSKPSTIATSSSESGSQPNPLENFEIELLWCIQQVEASLSKEKNPRLAENMRKNLSILKSNKAPLIKKKQLMRTLFGDYRGKMALEEKKFYQANSNIKFLAQPKVKEKATFIKKSSTSHSSSEALSSSPNKNLSEKENEISSLENISKEISEKVTEEKKESKNFSYKPSDNSFRFNFSIPENKSSSVEENENSSVESISKDMSEKVVIEDRTKSKKFAYKASDNLFRFNFSVPENNA